MDCYLDDSGTSSSPVVTLAGFLAAPERWKEVESDLEALLLRYEVPVLHAKEFHDTKPPFKGWGKIKKRSFAEEIFQATHGKLYGLSMTMRSSAKKPSENMSLIGTCFSVIMTHILLNRQIGPAIERDGVRFFIEDGNKNNNGIKDFFDDMSPVDTFQGTLKSLVIIKKESCRAIQLADFLAFYSRRFMRNYDRFDGKLLLPACHFLETIKRHGPVWMKSAPNADSTRVGDLDSLPDLASLRNVTGRRP